MNLTLIAAFSKTKRVIGVNNKLPWYIPSDLQRFKEYTMGKTVVMGRNTFFSLPHPLSGRTNIVLSSNEDIVYRHVHIYKQKHPDKVLPLIIVFNDISEIMDNFDALREYDDSINLDEIVVIGGESVYKQFLPYANRLVLTIVHDTEQKPIYGDTVFPEFDINKWTEVSSETVSGTLENKYGYDFKILELSNESVVIDFETRKILSKQDEIILRESKYRT